MDLRDPRFPDNTTMKINRNMRSVKYPLEIFPQSRPWRGYNFIWIFAKLSPYQNLQNTPLLPQNSWQTLLTKPPTAIHPVAPHDRRFKRLSPLFFRFAIFSFFSLVFPVLWNANSFLDALSPEICPSLVPCCMAQALFFSSGCYAAIAWCQDKSNATLVRGTAGWF